MDELNRLIQMASEAEALEHAAEVEPGAAPEIRVVAASWRRTIAWSLAGASGLAACFTVAFVAMQGTPPVQGPIAIDPGRSPPERIARADVPDQSAAVPPAPAEERPVRPEEPPRAETRLVSAPSDTESVVIALFRATDGSYECVQVDSPEWGERAMADVGRGDLMQVAFRNPCTTLAPQVLLIGVEGRRGTIPTTMGDVQRIADRLRGAPMHQADMSSLAYAALPDLPVGSMVVAESVAIR